MLDVGDGRCGLPENSFAITRMNQHSFDYVLTSHPFIEGKRTRILKGRQSPKCSTLAMLFGIPCAIDDLIVNEGDQVRWPCALSYM